MITAFQPNAFQQNAFQIAISVVVRPGGESGGAPAYSHGDDYGSEEERIRCINADDEEVFQLLAAIFVRII